MQKVSLYLDEHLWEAFRILCLKSHISASKQVGLLVEQFLHEQACQGESSAKAEGR